MSGRHERTNQKLRTREALLHAARDILLEGTSVTVIAAAERAGVSKATAYRYFSDPAILASEAGLDLSVLPYEEVVAGVEGIRGKLLAISVYYLDLAIDHEAEFRNFVGLSLLAWRPNDTSSVVRRGGRRIAMYEAALADLEGDLSVDRKTALVKALAMATGAEAMIALYDVARADREEARAVVSDVADAIITRYLPQA